MNMDKVIYRSNIKNVKPVSVCLLYAWIKRSTIKLYSDTVQKVG